MDLFGEEPAPAKEEKIETVDMSTEEVENISHPREGKECLGHEGVQTQLFELFQNERPPHALIFAGPQGIGKSCMAYQLARFLLSQEGSEEKASRLITSGAHPDLLSIERAIDPVKGKQKASLDVAQVRKVAPFLRRTAAEGGWRVVIVDDSDTMNRNAQNALLKILEEPPNKALLVLVTHRVGALIPTIRSRCRVVPFQPLSDEVMRQLLQKTGHDLTPDEQDTLIQLAQGSFGKAQNYYEEGALETLGKILGALERYPNWDWPAIHAWADELSRPGQEAAFQAYQELMQLVWQNLVMTKARGGVTPGKPLDMEAFAALLQNSSLEQLSKICENLQEHFETVQRANLDKRQGVLGSFSLMKTA